MEMTLTSPAFEQGSIIPAKYTCDGLDVSPPLRWEGVPNRTKGLALVADDPDAPVGTWVHWVIWNIPAQATGLPEALPKEARLPDGSRQGINDFGRHGYGGPCPPSGTHRYYFRLYALDTELDLATGATKADLMRAIQGHVLAQCQLMGRYSRARRL